MAYVLRTVKSLKASDTGFCPFIQLTTCIFNFFKLHYHHCKGILQLVRPFVYIFLQNMRFFHLLGFSYHVTEAYIFEKQALLEFKSQSIEKRVVVLCK